MFVSEQRREEMTPFSGSLLAGTTSSVTSLEGDDVTMSCIFTGRCVYVCSWLCRMSSSRIKKVAKALRRRYTEYHLQCIHCYVYINIFRLNTLPRWYGIVEF